MGVPRQSNPYRPRSRRTEADVPKMRTVRYGGWLRTRGPCVPRGRTGRCRHPTTPAKAREWHVWAHSALPDHDHPPTESLEGGSNAAVAPSVGGELRRPELGSRAWDRREPASAVPVPEASVHHDHRPQRRKHDVRSARQCPHIHPKPKSPPVQRAAHDPLGTGVGPSDAPHDAAAHLSGHSVGHADQTIRVAGFSRFWRTVCRYSAAIAPSITR